MTKLDPSDYLLKPKQHQQNPPLSPSVLESSLRDLQSQNSNFPNRLVGSRPSPLRRGGGWETRPGWTDQKWSSCKKWLELMHPNIRSAVTIAFPQDKCPSTYVKVNNRLRDWFRKRQKPAVCVWEGPLPHCHIALTDPLNDRELKRLAAFLERQWVDIWETPMEGTALMWKPAASSGQVLGYLLKKEKNGILIKGCFEFLPARPWWRTGLTNKTPRQS